MCVCSHVCVCHSVLKRCMSLRTLSGFARCLNTLYRCTLKGLQATIFAQTERFSSESRTTSGVTWKTTYMRKTLARCTAPDTVLLQKTRFPAHTSFRRAPDTVLLQKPRFSVHTSFRRAPSRGSLHTPRIIAGRCKRSSLHTPHSAELRTLFCC